MSPIDASSGQQRHHRLNRYGDRQANWALHVIIISRLRWHKHTPTQDYMARRLAEGRTKKMVMRCLKPHLIREVHCAITTDLAQRSRSTESASEPLDVQGSSGSEPQRRRSHLPGSALRDTTPVRRVLIVGPTCASWEAVDEEVDEDLERLRRPDLELSYLVPLLDHRRFAARLTSSPRRRTACERRWPPPARGSMR